MYKQYANPPSQTFWLLQVPFPSLAPSGNPG
eukprot:Gb_05301 [translate_table: standard]